MADITQLLFGSASKIRPSGGVVQADDIDKIDNADSISDIANRFIDANSALLNGVISIFNPNSQIQINPQSNNPPDYFGLTHMVGAL